MTLHCHHKAASSRTVEIFRVHLIQESWLDLATFEMLQIINLTIDDGDNYFDDKTV